MAEVPHRTLRSIAEEKGTKASDRFTDPNYCGPCGGSCRGHGEQPQDHGSGTSGLVSPPAPFRIGG